MKMTSVREAVTVLLCVWTYVFSSNFLFSAPSPYWQIEMYSAQSQSSLTAGFVLSGSSLDFFTSMSWTERKSYWHAHLHRCLEDVVEKSCSKWPFDILSFAFFFLSTKSVSFRIFTWSSGWEISFSSSTTDSPMIFCYPDELRPLMKGKVLSLNWV